MTDSARRQPLLLRYRFDRRTQASAHLHLQKRRALLFFPDPTIRSAAGNPAMVELVFDDSEQTRLFAGEVAAVIPGQGLWVRTADGEIGEECQGELPTRRHRRLGANLFVELRRGERVRLLASLHDLSPGGAQLGGGLEGFDVKDRVELRLLTKVSGVPVELGRAFVSWVENGRAGVQFDRTDEPSRLAVGKLYNALLASWAAAPVARHSPGCCIAYGCLDPAIEGVRLLAG